MNILVTGSSGYIGTLLVSKLKNQGHNVILYDIKEGNDIKDLRKVVKLIKDNSIQILYHLAAIRNVTACQSNYEAKFINQVCSINLGLICERFNVKMIFTSTCAVTDLCNDYSKQKNNAEISLRKKSVIVRLSNVVGAYPGYQIHPFPSLTENIFSAIKSKSNKITLYGNCERNFIFVEDVVNRLIKAISLDVGVYEFNSKISVDMITWISLIELYTNTSLYVEKLEKKSYDSQDLTQSSVYDPDEFRLIMDSYVYF